MNLQNRITTVPEDLCLATGVSENTEEVEIDMVIRDNHHFYEREIDD